MSIYLDKNSKVFVQGITGAEGSYHTGRMLAYGTNIVGGVTPGKGGQKTEHGLPVFNTVEECVAATGATHQCIFVPPGGAADALFEAYEAGVRFSVCITEGVPVHDMLRVVGTTPGMRIIGPNCPGLISPGKSSIGIMPGHIFKEGNVGLDLAFGNADVRSRRRAHARGPGPIDLRRHRRRSDHRHDVRRLLARVQERSANEGDRVCGEIGGSDEEDAGAFIKEHLAGMPIVGFIGGRNAPPGKSLGHAGAIISGGFGTPESKIKAFEAAGVPVADRPSDIPRLLAERMSVLA